MTEFVGVFGFQMTRPIRAGIFHLEPCFASYNEAKDRAEDCSHYFLTAIGKLQNDSDANSVSDLAAAMTFCEQKSVVVNGPFRMPTDTTVEQFRTKLPEELKIPAHRQGAGALIIDDTFASESRCAFLDLCLQRLGDESFVHSTGFRRAFYRCVEGLRMDPSYIDLTYYLDFSALEILARTIEGDETSIVAHVATTFLRKLGFDVVQDDPSRRHHAMQTYAHLRNSLFHWGKFEAFVREGDREVFLSLTDYEDSWHRLVADVLLKVLGFDDRLINWNRWLDRMPFCPPRCTETSDADPRKTSGETSFDEEPLQKYRQMR